MKLPEYLEHAQEYGALRINADQDAYTVFELAESKIVNPLPRVRTVLNRPVGQHAS